ncbi:hypothetical protein M0R04_06775 [Candidatus Dojkabacteria bacterium]|nr:hypothetical protein [Candidatus Dojkabacteria bacterium]
MCDDMQDDVEVNIRTDLWPTMSTQQLSVQQELVLDKLNLLSYMSQGDPTVMNLRCALDIAMADLNKLINNKITVGKHKVVM